MQKKLPLFIFLFFYSLLAGATGLPTEVGSDASPWLLKADTYMNALDSELNSTVKIYQEQKLSKERKYTVYTQKPRKTIVLFQHHKEKGQKVLMNGHNFWLFLPRSKRGIRITAQQKLFGDAATGDLTTIRWSDDYQGKVIACEAELCQLKLEKKRRGPTYRKIILYLNKENALPIKANLYLNEHKIAKKATYLFRKQEGDTHYRIREVKYQSVIRKKQTTRVIFDRIIDKVTPTRWYTPSYLASHSKLK